MPESSNAQQARSTPRINSFKRMPPDFRLRWGFRSFLGRAACGMAVVVIAFEEFELSDASQLGSLRKPPQLALSHVPPAPHLLRDHVRHTVFVKGFNEVKNPGLSSPPAGNT